MRFHELSSSASSGGSLSEGGEDGRGLFLGLLSSSAQNKGLVISPNLLDEIGNG